MKRFAPILVSGLLAFPLAQALAAPPSPTPQTRTYVSGTGNDSNACTVSSPCKSFSAALALTVAGGEIYVLNSANYGVVTINKAVTINAEGATGGVLAPSGAGITVSAGANDLVTLRGLDIDGAKSGSVGIQFTSGRALNVQKTTVRNFVNTGINSASNGTLIVSDSAVTNNGSNGIVVGSGSASANATIARVTATGNGVGILASGAVNVAITDTVTGNNNYGIGASAAAVMVRSSTAASNAVGIAADGTAVVRVSQSTVAANGTGWQKTNGGQIISYGNNNVAGNTTDGTPSSTVALQ
jgi:hypothetical protein